LNEFEIIHYPQINGLNLFFDTVDYRTPHIHPELELIWIVEGRLEINCGSVSAQAEPDTLVIFNPGQPHEFHKVEESCTFLCFQLSPECFEHVYPDLRRQVIDNLFPDAFLLREERESIRRTLLALLRAYCERQACYELYCQAQAGMILYQLLCRMPTHSVSHGEATEQQRRNDRLMRLLAYVDENYMHKIRLADFAEMEGRSVGYLSHFIKETMNQTFQDYVNTVRFNAACKLIHSGGKRMLDVCVETGFSDYRYFSRTFQQRLGMTPEEYSRQQRESVPAVVHVHHSLHSLERFYARETCMEMLEKLEKSMKIGYL
jgi:AraC-like DNA-binding protein